jgi:Protein of unknown function (DUF2934)
MIAARSQSADLEIALCAYCIWEQEGRQSGQALDHWLQAELQVAASIWHESLAWTSTASLAQFSGVGLFAFPQASNELLKRI